MCPSAINRARVLQQQAEQLKNRQAAEDRAGRFEKHRNELAEARVNLEKCFTPTRILRHRRRIGPEKLPRLGELEDLLVQLRQRAHAQAPEDFTKGNEYKRFLSRIKTLVEEMRVLLDASWKEFQSELPPVNDKLLEEITAIPGQQLAVQEVRGLDKTLREKRVHPPRTEEEFQAVLDLAEKLRTKLSTLDDAHYPQAVRDFLRAARHANGADLDSLTDEVRHWLKHRQLLNKIRLRWIEGWGGKSS